MLRRSKVIVPAPLKTGRAHGTPAGLVNLIYDKLDRYLIPEKEASPVTKKNALTLTNEWVANNLEQVRQRYEAFKANPSSDVFIRWAVGHDWEYHLGRSGAL
ncbi:MAG: hypothetical protein LAP21_26655, partial [Acidobacteriia bacterium]|nr:hypothetical protein [Terriglobia bacterium]